MTLTLSMQVARVRRTWHSSYDQREISRLVYTYRQNTYACARGGRCGQRLPRISPRRASPAPRPGSEMRFRARRRRGKKQMDARGGGSRGTAMRSYAVGIDIEGGGGGRTPERPSYPRTQQHMPRTPARVDVLYYALRSKVW